MKILKASLISVIISVLVITIEPIRIFAGLASFVVFGMLITDAVKSYRKIKRAEDIKGKGRKKMSYYTELTEIISQQQKEKEGTAVFYVGEQLKDMAKRSEVTAELLLADLKNPDMDITAAEKQLKAYADKNHGKNKCFCISPDVAEKIFREFYGLPQDEDTAEKSEPKQEEEQMIDLGDFL